jgi:hypothetical protein
LAVGALLAIAIEKSMLVKIQQNRMLSQNLSYAGLVLILLGFFVIKEDTPFPGAYALFPTIGSALIIGFANSSNVVGKLLSLRPFTLIGLISYSAYMWHQPIFAFYKHLSLSTDSNIHKYVLAVLILPLSYLSWKYVENPFRNKAKFSRKFIFIFSTIGSVLFVAIGYWGVINKGFPDRAVNEKLEYLDYNADNRKLKLNSWVNVREAEKRFNEGSWFNSADSLPNLLLIGNSHSKDMYNTFLSSEEVQPKFEFARFEGEMRDLAKEKSPLYTSANYKQADVVMIVTHFYQEDLAFIEPLVERLLSDDKKVVLVKEIYKSTTINARTLADISIQEFLRDESARSDTSNIRALVNKVNKQYYDGRIDDEDLLRSKSDEIIDSIKQKHQEVVVLNRNDYAYDEDREICFALDMRLRKYFYDQRHNSLQGSKFFGKRIDKIKWLDPVYKLVDEVGKVNRVREDSVD